MLNSFRHETTQTDATFKVKSPTIREPEDAPEETAWQADQTDDKPHVDNDQQQRPPRSYLIHNTNDKHDQREQIRQAVPH